MSRLSISGVEKGFSRGVSCRSRWSLMRRWITNKIKSTVSYHVWWLSYSGTRVSAERSVLIVTACRLCPSRALPLLCWKVAVRTSHGCDHSAWDGGWTKYLCKFSSMISKNSKYLWWRATRVLIAGRINICSMRENPTGENMNFQTPRLMH
jgi:hypothetical protein